MDTFQPEKPSWKTPDMQMHVGDSAKCVMSKNEVEDSDFSALNSSLEEVSDDEISTKKEKHWRLGPEDLNDTVLYHFTESEIFKDLEQVEGMEKAH